MGFSHLKTFYFFQYFGFTTQSSKLTLKDSITSTPNYWQKEEFSNGRKTALTFETQDFYSFNFMEEVLVMDLQ